jgi:hypothetical protein
MASSSMADIDLFFEDPANVPSSSRVYGVLYLLRRDIRICLGIDPNTNSSIEYQALWPGAMAIMAGIDLLGKFLAGNDGVRQSGRRFRDFVEEYLQPISPDDATTIYQLRNALLHSFGLYSEHRNRIYRFVLTAERGPLVQNRESDSYWVDVLALHNKFETAVASYQVNLTTDRSLQDHFSAMFPKYGQVYIGKRTIVEVVKPDAAEAIAGWLLRARVGGVSSFDDNV